MICSSFRYFVLFIGAVIAVTVAACGPAGDPGDLGPVDIGPDLDTTCHWDCFGVSRCVDGLVRTLANAPVPCDRWTGECPSRVTYTCARGCRTDGVTTTSFRDDPVILCEEGRPKVAGEPCTTDADCQPPSVIGPGIDRQHLACDGTLCVSVPDPTQVDWLAPCAGASAIPVDPADGASYGTFRDPACSGGVCVFTEHLTCIESACTLGCIHDWDCPDDSTCETLGESLPIDGGGYYAGFCHPSEGTVLDCR